MRQAQKESQRRHAAKMRAAGRRLYAARINAKVADAIVATAHAKGMTAAALTEKIFQDYLEMQK